MRHFDQLIDKVAAEGYPDDVLSFLASEQGMARLARLFGSSDFLWDDFLRTRPQDLLHILENSIIQDKESMRRSLRSQLQSAAGLEEKKRILNAFKDREVFLIEVQHLLEPHVTLKDFSDALTNLAEIVVDEAAKICREHLGDGHGPFAICGLGKFGGREMGYASDLELMFVHDDQSSTPFFETLARQTIESIDSRAKGIFHVDLRLRPYGDAGVWSISFAEFQRYYSPDGDAAPFERQALIKLRLIAGDPTFGRQVETHRDAFTYSGAPWDNDDAQHLRQRQINELVKSNETNVKYGAGGIVDVEYAVQYLQLLHGRDRPELRLANTLEALEALRHSGIIDNSDYLLLNSAYLFLRALIDALRIVRGDASDLVLPLESSDEFKSLARRLGYNERDRKMAAMRLAADIREWMTKVHAYFLRRFGKT